MSSMINGSVVQHHPPPRVVSAGRAITHTTSPTSRSKMAARDQAQSWRGKYLRALNICPEDIELARRKAEAMATTTDGNKARLRAMSYCRGDFPDRNSISRSYSSSTEKEDEERKSLERSAQLDHAQHNQPRIQAVPLRVPSRAMPMNASSANASNPYGFALRPDLARGRRCHTEPFGLQERVSAPIQIPSVRSGVCTQLDGNDRDTASKTPLEGQRRRESPLPTPFGSGNQSVGMFSWEEPVAMQSAAEAVHKGWHVPHAAMALGDSREHAVAFSSTQDREFDDDYADSDHGGDIFEMDGLHDSNDHDENQSDNHTEPVAAKSRRRYRTASLNVVSSGREKRVHRPAFEDTEDASFDHTMSQSFVPPHQLVQRDCFSIGMRDEFKRRPANNI